MKDEYLLRDEQLKSIVEALDVLTMVYHACRDADDGKKGVSPGVIASAVSVASCVIYDIVDGIREETA